MPRRHAGRAIIVLESPWELDNEDANRSSVLPFVEGVAKLAGDMDVLHANYYDEASKEIAMKCLAKSPYRNTIVYIAAHGDGDQAGHVELLDIFEIVEKYAETCNITGVLIGSCYGAKDLLNLEVGIEGGGLRWSAGYASSAYWLPRTQVDCAILARMSELPPAAYRSADRMINVLGDAISTFSPRGPIGKDSDGDEVSLADSLRFMVQPEGQGHKARDVSEPVFARHEDNQV
ncbi:hypothetical protein [Massilia sp. HP4]|uniref:hypothetical protein n=1 Tax=Massilia sp. HP4 TaxID=2562316 RepID=UPI0010BFBC78|nr:hypothetical protein [Massilia sp. HP4]